MLKEKVKNVMSSRNVTKRKINVTQISNVDKVNNQHAITLIALVITIIVLIILATVTINFLLSENGIFKMSEEAKFKSDMKAYQETVEIYLASNNIANYLSSEIKIINAGVYSENPNMDIMTILPNLTQNYKNKVEVSNNEFKYVPVNNKDNNTKQEVKWCFEAGIKVKNYNSYEEFLDSIVEILDGKYIENKGIWCSEPDLTGFNEDKTYYVTYDNEGNEKIGNSIKKRAPEDWYDYKNKKWANIVTISEGRVAYFVWIPRYVYMIDAEAKASNSVKVRFVDKQNRYKGYVEGTNQLEEQQYLDTIPKYDGAGNQINFCLPDAFTWDGTPLSGYWLSKYEVSP